MTVDRSLILSRIALIRSNLNELEKIRQEGREAFRGSARTVAATRYLLQTSLEGMADVGNHLIARRDWKVSTSYRETMTVLAANGAVTPSKLPHYEKMMGFRNVLVHLYHQVDDQEVWIVVEKELGDFRDFLADILAYLDRAEST